MAKQNATNIIAEGKQPEKGETNPYSYLKLHTSKSEDHPTPVIAQPQGRALSELAPQPFARLGAEDIETNFEITADAFKGIATVGSRRVAEQVSGLAGFLAGLYAEDATDTPITDDIDSFENFYVQADSNNAMAGVRDWLLQVSDDFGESASLKEAELSRLLSANALDTPSALLHPAWWIYNVGNMAVQLLPSLAAGAATGGGTLGIPALRGFSLMGGMIEGSYTYRDSLRSGEDGKQALVDGTMMAVGSSILNYAGGLGVIKGGGLTKPGILARGRQLVRGGAAEGLSEYAEEPLDALIQGKDVSKALYDGFNVLPTAFLLGIIGGAVAPSFNNQGFSEMEKSIAELSKMPLSKADKLRLDIVKHRMNVVRNTRDQGIQVVAFQEAIQSYDVLTDSIDAVENKKAKDVARADVVQAIKDAAIAVADQYTSQSYIDNLQTRGVVPTEVNDSLMEEFKSTVLKNEPVKDKVELGDVKPDKTATKGKQLQLFDVKGKEVNIEIGEKGELFMSHSKPILSAPETRTAQQPLGLKTPKEQPKTEQPLKETPAKAPIEKASPLQEVVKEDKVAQYAGKLSLKTKLAGEMLEDINPGKIVEQVRKMPKDAVTALGFSDKLSLADAAKAFIKNETLKPAATKSIEKATSRSAKRIDTVKADAPKIHEDLVVDTEVDDVTGKETFVLNTENENLRAFMEAAPEVLDNKNFEESLKDFKATMKEYDAKVDYTKPVQELQNQADATIAATKAVDTSDVNIDDMLADIDAELKVEENSSPQAILDPVENNVPTDPVADKDIKSLEDGIAISHKAPKNPDLVIITSPGDQTTKWTGGNISEVEFKALSQTEKDAYVDSLLEEQKTKDDNIDQKGCK